MAYSLAFLLIVGPAIVQALVASEAYGIPEANATAHKAVVVVIGANGGTGKACVAELLRAGHTPRALTRSGHYSGPEEGVEEIAGDVKDLDSLRRAFVGAHAVIFTATAEGTEQSFKSVDNEGVVNTARAAKEESVEHVALISSVGISRCIIPVICEEAVQKINGEKALRRTARGTNMGYSIHRPGGLTYGPRHAWTELEFNQGDVTTGTLSRADTAVVAVAAAVGPYSHLASGKTFEYYMSSTRSASFPSFQRKIVRSSTKKNIGEMFAQLDRD